VADVEKTAAFYSDGLGFNCEYMAGSPAQFAICSRDGLAIMLRRVSAPDLINPSEAQGGTWDAFFWVDEVAGLHAELVERGVTVVYGPIIQEAYQMREFAIRDCDGHVLGFGETLNS
jgi:catechol 2,3-dioxygenase-like lactoylglutathione lyase family enzyme